MKPSPVLLLGLVACGSRTPLIGFGDLGGADTTTPVVDATSLQLAESGGGGPSDIEPDADMRPGDSTNEDTEEDAQSEPEDSASNDGASVTDVVLPSLDAPVSCPTPSAVIVGASCTLPPNVSCGGSPVPACGGTARPDCACQSHAWACVTSFPACDGGPCPPMSEVMAGAGCTVPPDVSCGGRPVTACGGTASPDCTCQSRNWECVTSFPVCDSG
jgi:hypothetical protein